MHAFEASIQRTVDYLKSDRAYTSLEHDPYWPKWDSPWWHMTLLWEMGLAARIPSGIVEAMVASMNKTYLKTFPFKAEDLPPGADPKRSVVCHCALGTMYQVLHATGRDVDADLPWARAWFLQYQLPDGGLNCNEEVYLRPEPASSVVSTLPPLEAILRCTTRTFTPEEQAFLDRGAAYLLKRRLLRAARTGNVIDQMWLRPCFPRFYEYDVLRGLSFVAAWSEARGQPLAWEDVKEAYETIDRNAAGAGVKPKRLSFAGEKTIDRAADGTWSDGPAIVFDLLTNVSTVNRVSPFLTQSWEEAKARLANLVKVP